MTNTLRWMVVVVMMVAALTGSNRLEALEVYGGENNAEVCFAGQCYLQSTLTTITWGWIIAGPIVIGGIIALSLANHHHHQH